MVFLFAVPRVATGLVASTYNNTFMVLNQVQLSWNQFFSSVDLKRKNHSGLLNFSQGTTFLSRQVAARVWCVPLCLCAAAVAANHPRLSDKHLAGDRRINVASALSVQRPCSLCLLQTDLPLIAATNAAKMENCNLWPPGKRHCCRSKNENGKKNQKHLNSKWCKSELRRIFIREN